MKVGDVVFLKSEYWRLGLNAIPLTVNYIHWGGAVEVKWWDSSSHRFQKNMFQLNALQLSAEAK